MTHAQRHKTFVSYHHEPHQKYADLLREELADVIIDRAVSDGDISDSLATDEIWRTIREDYISDATVTIVLIGRNTWSRKYVDWEIGSSFSKARNNSRCGVLGILLPDHPSYGKRPIDPESLPPRLVANIGGSDPYVRIYDWPHDNRLSAVRDWIEVAFQRRAGPAPNNNSKRFQRNRAVTTRDGISLTDVLIGGTIVVGAVATIGYVVSNLRKSQPSVSVTPKPRIIGRRNRLLLSSARSRRRRRLWLRDSEFRTRPTFRNRRIVR